MDALPRPATPPRRAARPRLREVLAVLALAGCAAGAWACRKRSSAAGGELSAFERYRRRSISSEAVDKLGYIYRAMSTYATMERVQRGGTGALARPQFPESAPLTPATIPRGTRVTDPPGAWDHPSWQALDFSISDPHYYSYEVISDGRAFTARAYGDIDGDGVYSTFERTGRLNDQLDVEGGRGIWMQNELE